MSKSNEPKSRGKKAYEKGAKLEGRVARWLKSQFGYKCKKNDLARGKISKRPYEIDVHGIKESVFGLMKAHLWVECKAYKIKRVNVTKLVESAKDVRDAYNDDIEKWEASMLMLVSSKGFDIDALGMANKYDIYCVKADRTFEFVGKMNRENFEDRENSSY
ncbi:MAG: hypothetical protein JW870_12695 [Candidatus Delongbacteria bacterium]|nr:hypothetical protein [Candidatus Delongbacteria bacterium]